jgi:hypothetical protein
VLLGDDEIRPYWLERQLDPGGPAFVPGGGGDPPENLTHRSWVVVGTLDDWERATVDPRGLVTPCEGGWSMDWWVGAEDRWHLPSREVAVRQSLVDGAPVVETLMRVPGGDIAHRAWAVRGDGPDPLLVVEVENRTATPVALALVVRPWGPTGTARVGAAGLEGEVVEVNGAPGIYLPRPPRAVATATDAEGDVASIVTDDRAEPPPVDAVDCPAGRAQVATVFPLTHRTSIRVVLPMCQDGAPARSKRKSSPSVAVADLPDSARVANGWRVQADRGVRIELPDERLATMLTAARCRLLLGQAGDDLVSVPTGAFDYTEAAGVLEALTVFGAADEAGRVLATWEDRQALDGRFLGDDRRWDAAGGALVALAAHWRRTGDDDLVDRLVGPVAKAAHWIHRKRAGRFGLRSSSSSLLPPGQAPPWIGPQAVTFHDAWWSLAGMRETVAMLVAIDQPEAAEEISGFAEELAAGLESAVVEAVEATGGIVPAGPGRGVDGGIVGILDAVLLGVAGPSERTAATLDALRDRYTIDGAVHQAVEAAGLSPRLTARLARVELRAGDPRALERITWLARAGGDLASWPEVVHPRTGGGSVGRGSDTAAAAEVLLALRDLVVLESLDRLAVSPIVPDDWWGQGWEVHDLPTIHGRLGVAVRWHGDRPALLWELEPFGDGPEVVLTAPGLDPSWSSTEHRGEALLAPVDRPEDGSPVDGGSLS